MTQYPTAFIVEGFLRKHVKALRNPPPPYKEMGFTADLAQYILDFGEAMPYREHDWTVYPEGEAGQCYMESANLALDHPELTYVEGMAVNFGSIPLSHGWCVDEEGYVVDVTWHPSDRTDLVSRRQYFGVEIPDDRLRELLVDHETYGVLPFMVQEELGLDYIPMRAGL